jgi:hypothetical protein
MAKKKILERLFIEAIDPCREGNELYETKDGYITNGFWAVKKELLEQNSLPYEKYLKACVLNWTVTGEINDNIMKFDPEIYYCSNIRFAYKKVGLNGKIKVVYINNIKEAFNKVAILKEYADFLTTLCRKYRIDLYWLERKVLEPRGYFVWCEERWCGEKGGLQKEIAAICCGFML